MVKVPLFTRVPQTAAAPAFRVGWFPPTGIAGIITLVDGVGIPSHQFAELFQSLLKVPSQVPELQAIAVTFNVPVEVGKNQMSFWLSAPDNTLPQVPPF